MNYYTQITAEDSIDCTEEDYEILKSLLEINEDDDCHGIEMELCKDSNPHQLYLYSEEAGDLELLPGEFLEKLSEVIAKNDLKYWEFGYAYSASRSCPGSCGGSKARVHRDGTVENLTSIWTGLLDHYLVIGRIPFEDEDTEAHVVVDEEHDPVEMFIRNVLYAESDEELPEELVDEDGMIALRHQSGEPWATSIRCYKLAGPPIDGPTTYSFQKGNRTWA